jgi:DNA adenine methylase
MSDKPFSWYGGKSALVPVLLSFLPAHQVYVEVFGGSAALLFAKAPSSLEVLNDLDSGVVNFFRVLRDPVQADALQRLLSLTPYAREEYYDCLHTWEETDDPVEQARRWYCAVIQTRNNALRATGWRFTKVPASNPARAWTHSITHLADCVARLSQVQIDHRDFEQVIRAYDGPDTCFYLDPTYHAETRRKQRCYQHEMTPADHARLLACIVQVQGMVILSGYEHPMYQEALSTWECSRLNVTCASAVDAAGADAGDRAPAVLRRTECIWRNPACLRRLPSLFAEMEV